MIKSDSETWPPTMQPDRTLKTASQDIIGAHVSQWGWLPALSLISALALLGIAISNNASRTGASWAAFPFWIGLAVLVIPATLRQFLPGVPRAERIGLVVLVGLSLYLVKVLHSPSAFDFHDEFLHWRTATSILETGHLFRINSLLPVSPLYPGLEIGATAFSQISGWSMYEGSLIMLGIGRVLLVMALFLFFEQISRSKRAAGIATLLYMANSNFVFFDSQFSYESLALPLACVALFAVAHREQNDDHSRSRLILLILPLICVIAVTHHLTGYAVAVIFVLWTIAAFMLDQAKNNWQRIGVLAILTLIITWGWTIYVGSATFGYLTPVIRGGVGELLQLILGEASGRELFKSSTGLIAPLWERITGVLSVIGTMLILPLGAWHLLHRYRQNGLALGLAAIVVAYPVLLIMRLTSSGWEIANRSSEFLFWGIAFAAAVGIVGTWKARSNRRTIRLLAVMFTVWAAIIFAGGVIAGWPFWARLPGPYLVAADARSIEPQGVAAAQWAGAYLTPKQRISADRINGLLMGNYGKQDPVTHLSDNVYISEAYFAPRLGTPQIKMFTETGIRYVVVDQRLSTSLPAFGIYFEGGEPGSETRTTPVDPSVLNKFSREHTLSLLFDDGSIRIYDAGALHETR